LGVVRWTAEQAYEQLAPAVRGYFRARGALDPDDLTGDVFVSVTRGLASFHGDADALRRWVFTIAHHRMVDQYRRAGQDRHVSMAEVPDAPQVVVAAVAAVDDDMTRALAMLSDDQREVVVLRFVADLALKDVARIVGKRQGAVKMLQSRGLERLRELLPTEGA
jgi:RNA polymerase sigma-70 factor (ECF subfamily)